MVKCDFCKREMLTAKSCSFDVAVIDGKYYDRVPNFNLGDRCGDCGVTYGNIHHFGCDSEACCVPNCSEPQFAFCQYHQPKSLGVKNKKYKEK